LQSFAQTIAVVTHNTDNSSISAAASVPFLTFRNSELAGFFYSIFLFEDFFSPELTYNATVAKKMKVYRKLSSFVSKG
jgi:hypothetical protein